MTANQLLMTILCSSVITRRWSGNPLLRLVAGWPVILIRTFWSVSIPHLATRGDRVRIRMVCLCHAKYHLPLYNTPWIIFFQTLCAIISEKGRLSVFFFLKEFRGIYKCNKRKDIIFFRCEHTLRYETFEQ